MIDGVSGKYKFFNSFFDCIKSANELIMVAKDIFSISIELDTELKDAYIHASEYILKNLTNITYFANRQDRSKWPDSIKLLMLTRNTYLSFFNSGEPSENAHASAGKYFIENAKNLSGEMESKYKQSEDCHVSLKRERSFLPSYEEQSSNPHKRPRVDENDKIESLIDYTGGTNGQDFFGYQYDSDESEDDSCIDLYPQALPDANVSRITTTQEHLELLKSVIREADNYVQIASYGICIEILNEIKDELLKLKSKGVGIHFYNSDRKPCSAEVMKFIQDNNICYNVMQLHAKFLMSDGHIAAIGSFNWLSSDSFKYSNGSNGSLVISGEICAALSSQISVYVRQYIYKAQGKNDAITSFRNLGTTNTHIYFDLNDGSTLTYLPTLDAHRKFINAAFEMAKSSLTLCSPFIYYSSSSSSSSDFLMDLPPRLLAKTANRGVKIRVICGSACAHKLHEAYGLLLKAHRNIELVPTNNMHQKTLVVDEHLIAEGSFNWLSASRDEKSSYHNCELTIVCEGPKAKPLIDSFNQKMNLRPQAGLQLTDNKIVDIKRSLVF
ncbi:MAG: phosphatidylserine/phosphatidylglycerophosphate/cardiolipin synthase family protein [Candidatus Berkiella sp.]